MTKNNFYVLPLLLICVAMLAVGCQDKLGGSFPMTVKVTMDGTALEGATVFLSEASGTKSAVGITDATGVAKIKSTEGGWEGVFPGEYAVTIKKTEMTTSSTPPPGSDIDIRNMAEEDRIFAVTRELLPAKYGKESTSELKISHANKKGHFEFDLSSNP